MSDEQDVAEAEQETAEQEDEEESTDQRDFPGAVAEVRDNRKLVINRGSREGVREGMKFLVYKESEEEVIDPETDDALGRLEIVKGTGKVTHVQEQMATIVSVTEDPTQSSEGGSAGPAGGGGNPMAGGGPMGGGGGPMGGGGNPMGGGGGGGGMMSAMAQMMGGGGGNPMGGGPGGPGGGPGGRPQPPGGSSGSSFDPFDNPERGDLVRPLDSNRGI